MSNFSVNRRNPGHWDVWTDKARAFRIRGGENGKPFVINGENEYRGVTNGWLEQGVNDGNQQRN